MLPTAAECRSLRPSAASVSWDPCGFLWRASCPASGCLCARKRPSGPRPHPRLFPAVVTSTCRLCPAPGAIGPTCRSVHWCSLVSEIEVSPWTPRLAITLVSFSRCLDPVLNGLQGLVLKDKAPDPCLGLAARFRLLGPQGTELQSPWTLSRSDLDSSVLEHS